MWVVFANAKATHIFFSKNISVYVIFNYQSFNDTLTNDIVSFEQLGPGFWSLKPRPYSRYSSSYMRVYNCNYSTVNSSLEIP